MTGRAAAAAAMPAAAAAVQRRPRRFDPQRKQRILDAALEVIAEHGVAGTTHRLIAETADVPLGSLTYHFDGLDDLRAQAFGRLAERGAVAYAAHFEGVRTRAQLLDALTELVHNGAGADAAEWAASYELYLAALRDPGLRAVTEAWMQSSRTVLMRYLDQDTARAVDALIEGLIMHRMLSTSPSPRTHTRQAFARAVPEIRTP